MKSQMKYIFDFDDVLFNTSKNLREQLYRVLENQGIHRETVQEYEKQERSSGFSLKKILAHFKLDPSLYDEVMRDPSTYVNHELLELAKTVGRKNCFIVTYGDPEFQMAKIKGAGIADLFADIFIVLDGKKKPVEKICDLFPKEPVVFIDDRAEHFEDLDFKKYPNLKTILYTEQSVDKLMKEIEHFDL